MGGNALKKINPVRVSSNDILAIFWRIEHLSNIYGFTARVVPWCLDKETHGDIDIIVSNFKPVVDHVLSALEVPSGEEYRSRNSNVLSVGVPLNGGHVQVDFIEMPHNEIPHTLLYYSGGGLGMIIGRVAAWHGYVFASEGLRLRLDSSKQWSKDILFETLPKNTLEFLGYDPLKCGGFRTEIDVWRYGMSSPWSKPWMFLMENTTAHNRTRDKKRPAFMRFQEWLLSNYNCKPAGKFADKATFDNALNYASVSTKYQWLCDSVNKQKEEFEFHKYVNKSLGMDAVKYNFPNLDDKSCGEIIRKMQEFLPSKEERLVEMKENASNLIEKARTLAYWIGKAQT